MIEKKETETQAPKKAAPKAKKVEPACFNFINSTKRNVFTTKGRCGPGEKVRLLASEGQATVGLERCGK